MENRQHSPGNISTFDMPQNFCSRKSFALVHVCWGIRFVLFVSAGLQAMTLSPAFRRSFYSPRYWDLVNNGCSNVWID